jgi:hypothetical protein
LILQIDRTRPDLLNGAGAHQTHPNSAINSPLDPLPAIRLTTRLTF